MNAHIQPGVWGVLATPFTGSGLDIDNHGLANLVEHAVGSGVAGLTVLGVFGEASRLAWNERRLVIETVLDTSDLPLVIGCTSLDTAQTIDEARMAVELVGGRLAGVMIQANSSDRTTLETHLQAVNEVTGADIVIQDYPAASGVTVSSTLLGELATQLPAVCAVKAEAAPTPLAVADLTSRCDIPVFGGLGGINLLDELACGAAGAMTGFSYPEALVACVQSWDPEDPVKSRAELLNHLPLINFEQQVGIALAIRKECLRQRDLIDEARVRPPARPLPESLLPLLAAHLQVLEGG